MTNRETIEAIKMAIEEVVWNYPIDYTVAFEEAIRALLKADKYRWHDLRESSYDLPRVVNGNGESEYVLVKTGCFEWCDMEMAYYSYAKRQWSIDNYVLAWRYIEPFKDEECVFWMNDNIQNNFVIAVNKQDRGLVIYHYKKHNKYN